MYTLYIANKNYSSWSLRPWVLMRELGIPFEERLEPFLPEGGSSQLFKKFSPSGRVPCLHDGELRVWDSLAITEYLAEKHPRVWPEERIARAWARSAAAEMHSGFGTLREICSFSAGLRIRLEGVPAKLEADLTRLTALWEEGLSRFGGPFLAGARFTAVDAFFAPVAFRVQTYTLTLKGSSRAYVDRLLKLPSMKEWEAAALAEPWREPEHESHSKRAGVLLEDLRAK